MRTSTPVSVFNTSLDLWYMRPSGASLPYGLKLVPGEKLRFPDGRLGFVGYASPLDALDHTDAEHTQIDLYRVRLSGSIQNQGDGFSASRCQVLWTAPATNAITAFRNYLQDHIFTDAIKITDIDLNQKLLDFLLPLSPDGPLNLVFRL